MLRENWLRRELQIYLKGFWKRRKRPRNAEKFAEIRHPHTSRAAVYQARIYHDRALREINRPLSFGPPGADGGVRPAANLRSVGDTVSYRDISAPHKLALQAAGIGAPGSDPPAIEFPISNAKHRSLLHCTIHGPSDMIESPSSKSQLRERSFEQSGRPTVTIPSNSRPLCGCP